MVHLTTALDPSSSVPLYEQLYHSLAGEMRSGTLSAGVRMPGKRRLAAELSVSVNTVDAAYQMLAAEGYLSPGSAAALCTGSIWPCPPARPVCPSRRRRRCCPPRRRCGTTFPPGRGPGLFPFRTWARLQKELLYSSPELLTHGDAQGDPAPAAGTGRISFRIPGRAVRAASDRGGSRSGIPAEPAGPTTAGHGRSGNAGLPPRKAGAGKQRRALLLPAGGRRWSLGGSAEPVGCGGVLCHAQSPVPHRRHHAGGTQSRASALGSPQAGRAVHHRGRLRPEFRFDTRPLPSLQGMAGADGPVVYPPPAPAVWPPASALPIWCFRSTFCPHGERSTGSIPAP